MPGISLIILSHNKPTYVKEAVQSVLSQTYTDWEVVLVDSGVLLKQGFFDYLKDPRITVIASEETPEIVKTKTISCWCLNRVLNSGRLKGELFMYLCDDDLLYPAAFTTFWDYYTANGREPQAMYASQDIGIVQPDGRTQIVGERIADRPAGKFCKGRKLDCQVDYLQFCVTFKALAKFREVYGTTDYHSEDPAVGYHADGLFMEDIGAFTKIHPINTKVSLNRRTPDSAFTAYASGRLGWFLIRAQGKWRALLQMLGLGTKRGS